MKNFSCTRDDAAFAPIHISFTIETLDEFNEMRARMNVSQSDLISCGAYDVTYHIPTGTDGMITSIWAELNGMVSD